MRQLTVTVRITTCLPMPAKHCLVTQEMRAGYRDCEPKSAAAQCATRRKHDAS